MAPSVGDTVTSLLLSFLLHIVFNGFIGTCLTLHTTFTGDNIIYYIGCVEFFLGSIMYITNAVMSKPKEPKVNNTCDLIAK
ncbi:putative integral membrane protein [Babesia bovis T2Bo]|uniref:putative integral membrane protein n=1 Tax=Babesia bovis T2Bo TaxID=484906 RepID=UPI001DA687B7|nr:putative integral membrane protein [Babesia bovis T2Bo]KAG6439899.1 putative integral membrane protein [Babesia bovis T2Bo]